MARKRLSPEVEPVQGIPRRRELLGFIAGVAATVPASLMLRQSQGEPKRSARQERRLPTRLLAPLGRRLDVVIVVPVQPRADKTEGVRAYRLGRALGEFFDHGSDADLAPLAAMSLECMGDDEIETPAAPEGAYWLRVGEAAVHFQLPEGYDDAAIDARIAAVSEAFGRAPATVAPATTSDLPVRLREVARRCERGESIPSFLEFHRERSYLETRRDLAHAPITPAEVDRYGRQLLGLAARATGKPRDALVALLAARVRARLSKLAVPGSEWVSNDACGTWYEERPDQRAGISCGMGHVPERGRRFLSFFTQV